MNEKIYFLSLAISITAVGLVQGQGYFFDGGLGYASLSLKGDNNNETLNGWGPAFRLGFGAENGPQAFVGLHNTRYPGDTFDSAIWDASITTPEIGIGWNQKLSDSDFFLEPSLVVGAPIASYTRRINTPKTIPELLGEDETEVGWIIRPGIILGYQSGNRSCGIEISYGFLDINFTNDVNEIQKELYIGFFGRFSW